MLSNYGVQFLEIQKLQDTSFLIDSLNKQNILFSYFEVNQQYYLFLYKDGEINLYELVKKLIIIQQLDKRERKLRSLRGFFLDALEIQKSGDRTKNLESIVLVPFLILFNK